MTKPKIIFLIIFALFIVVLNIALYTWNQSLKVFDVPYLVNTPVDRVAFDKQGQVWVSGNGSLSVYKDGIPVQVFTNEDSPALGGNLSVLEVDAKGRVWVAPQGKERKVDLAFFDGTKWSTLFLPHGGLDFEIYALAIDSEERAWIGTKKHILYNNDGNNWERISTGSNTIHCIATDNQGRVWIGGENLYVFDGKVRQTFTPDNSPLLHGGVHAIAFDQQGGVWIASGQAHGVGYFGGVSFFNGKDWIVYPDISTVGFEDIAVDGAGRVWAIMPFGRGVLVFDGKSWKNHKFPVSDIGANLTTDEDGNIWIPTSQNGVAFIPPDSQKYFSPLANIISLAIASHGLIYLDTFLIGIWLYFAVNAWRIAGLNLADLLRYFNLIGDCIKKQSIPLMSVTAGAVGGFLIPLFWTIALNWVGQKTDLNPIESLFLLEVAMFSNFGFMLIRALMGGFFGYLACQLLSRKKPFIVLTGAFLAGSFGIVIVISFLVIISVR